MRPGWNSLDQCEQIRTLHDRQSSAEDEADELRRRLRNAQATIRRLRAKLARDKLAPRRRRRKAS